MLRITSLSISILEKLRQAVEVRHTVSLRSWAKDQQSRCGSCKVIKRSIWLGSEAEQSGDEESLTDRISFCHPSRSAILDHVYRFGSLYVRHAL